MLGKPSKASFENVTETLVLMLCQQVMTHFATAPLFKLYNALKYNPKSNVLEQLV